jgi:hypothetical protein
MSFFKQFPTLNYDLNKDGSITKIVNIFRSVRPVQTFIDDPSLYRLYEIKNGERPDIVSQRLYGTPEYYWTFFVVNQFLHDGYKVWPMSQEAINKFLDKEYNGYAIVTNPRVEDGLSNSIAGKFRLGETIVGGNSGASGILTKKIIDLNQLVIQDVTNGPYLGDGQFNNNNAEIIVGQTSTDSVATFNVYPYREAPHHYYILDEEGTEREYASRLFIDDIHAEPTNVIKYVSNQEYVYSQNDERSKIRVINPKQIGQFVEKFKRLINE